LIDWCLTPTLAVFQLIVAWTNFTSEKNIKQPDWTTSIERIGLSSIRWYCICHLSYFSENCSITSGATNLIIYSLYHLNVLSTNEVQLSLMTTLSSMLLIITLLLTMVNTIKYKLSYIDDYWLHSWANIKGNVYY
jgi:hypothetical protein